MFGILAFFHWQNWQTATDHPISLSLSTSSHLITEARQRVIVEDAHWDCASMTPIDSGSNPRVEAMFTDETGTVLVVAWLRREVPCAELVASAPEGEMYRMSEGRYAHLLAKGRPALYPEATSYLELCGYCSPVGSKMTLCLSLFFVGLGLGMYPLLSLHRRTQRHHSLR